MCATPCLKLDGKTQQKSVNNFSLWESTKHPFLHQEFKPEENSTFSKPEFMKMSWVPQSKGRSNIFKEEFLTHPFITPNWFLYVACKGPSPSSIYSWSIDHILEHEFCYLGCWALLGKISETTEILLKYATFWVGFFNFLWAKKKLKIFLKIF